MFCGDFNARTGCLNSAFIINDDGLYVPVPSNYLQDSNIKHRLSQDRVIDSKGREFFLFMYRKLDTYSQWQILWRLSRHVYIIQI